MENKNDPYLNYNIIEFKDKNFPSFPSKVKMFTSEYFVPYDKTKLFPVKHYLTTTKIGNSNTRDFKNHEGTISFSPTVKG